MQRRQLLGLIVGGVVLAVTGCANEQGLAAGSGSTVVAGISARAARELARSHLMLGQRPLPAATRRSLEKGKALPAGITFQPIPERMVQSLPAVQDHEWRAAGIDLLLVDAGTMVVADILRGPLR